MKLTTIRIERFRGIRRAEIAVGSELALVGQNSGGKSSILRALNSFFNYENERSNFQKGAHSFQKSSTAIIDLEFKDAPNQCTLPRITSGESTIRARLKYRKTPVWEIFSNGKWASAPTELHKEVSKYIRYVYIPVTRSEKIVGWGPDSILKEAVISWVQQHTRNRDRISPKVTEVTDIIKNRTLVGLGKHLRKLTHLQGSFSFELDYAKKPDYSMLLEDLILFVKDGETTFDILECGSGTQSLAAIALYSYLAETIGGIYILGIEEPEQNLHPQAQRSLLSALKDLPLQVIFTTHSTIMIDNLDHEEVVLCRRISSNTRGFEITATQLKPTFWQDHGIDRDRYYTFHRRKNSEFFYANHVILTESPIDAEVIKFLIGKDNNFTLNSNVSIISLDGVNSLPYVYHLFNDLEISFSTVVDKDYFLPYFNDELEASRDARGFPKYKKQYKNNCLIKDMVSSATKRNELLNLFFTNHSKAMGILEENNVF